MESTQSRTLNSNILKLIAITAMTTDHLAWAIFPGYSKAPVAVLLHIIGRLTAPIMWFFIAEGCHYTRRKGRYLLRLFGFALISHFAYDFAFGIPFFNPSYGIFNRTSVLWSLALGATVIFFCECERAPKWLQFVVIAVACALGFISDWSTIAVMCPVFLYMHRGNFKRQALDIVIWSAVYATVYILFIDLLYGVLQMFTALSVPLLAKYNGERGKWKGMKWFFYAYYPAHLVLIGLLRLLLNGDIPLIS